MDSLRAGRDPYADAMTVQQAYYAHLAQHQGDPLPFSYIYSPITLPVLRGIAAVPYRISAGIYWPLYGACAWMILQFGLWASGPGERRILSAVAPACLYFPGLLHHDTIFSGNLAVVVYGCALSAAIYGWRRAVWTPFYAVVVVASCFKAPLLCLLAIPVLSVRGQWRSAGVSAALGVALFAAQPRIWPTLFAHYLQALDFQFRVNRDFGSSPVGVAADALLGRAPYALTSAAVYGLVALPVGWVLLALSRRYFAGDFSLRDWVPVMLLGIFLLNPRLMEYDLLPLSLPMLLIVWRSFSRRFKGHRLAWGIGVVVVLLNVFMLLTESFKPTECVLLLSVFGLGCRDLWRRGAESTGVRAAAESASVNLNTVTFAGAVSG